MYAQSSISIKLLRLCHTGAKNRQRKNLNEIRHSLCMPHGMVKIVANYEENDT